MRSDEGPRHHAQGDSAKFHLHIIGGNRLARLVAKAKHQSYYTGPWPVADYDADGEDAPPTSQRLAADGH